MLVLLVLCLMFLCFWIQCSFCFNISGVRYFDPDLEAGAGASDVAWDEAPPNYSEPAAAAGDCIMFCLLIGY